jgi:hypothetical protein
MNLTTRFWIDAYLTRLRLADIPAYVVAHGDDTVGTVMVKLALLNGQARAYERGFDLASNARTWRTVLDGPEPEVDAMITRARGRDRDLWVIEVEDRMGRTLLDQEGLSS